MPLVSARLEGRSCAPRFCRWPRAEATTGWSGGCWMSPDRPPLDSSLVRGGAHEKSLRRQMMAITGHRRGGQDGGAGAPDTLKVENPATGQPIGELPSLDRDATLALVRRARAAQPAWEAVGFRGRGAL